jgi:hypothetical protein
MVKNLHKISVETVDKKHIEVSIEQDFFNTRHVPRSVCDSERDRRNGRDPLKEEELQ